MAWILFIPLLTGIQIPLNQMQTVRANLSHWLPFLCQYLFYLDWKVSGQTLCLCYVLSQMQSIGIVPIATIEANNDDLLIKRHLETLWLVRAWLCQLVPCPGLLRTLTNDRQGCHGAFDQLVHWSFWVDWSWLIPWDPAEWSSPRKQHDSMRAQISKQSKTSVLKALPGSNLSGRSSGLGREFRLQGGRTLWAGWGSWSHCLGLLCFFHDLSPYSFQEQVFIINFYHQVNMLIYRVLKINTASPCAVLSPSVVSNSL